MNKQDPFVSRFSPNRTAPKVLAEIHVERDDLLNDAVKRVRKSVTGKKRKHLLFLGARGTGKTHLISLLVHRLRQDENVFSTVRIAWLNEDETSLSYAELLVRVYRALMNEYPEEFEEAALNEAFKLGATEAGQYLEGLVIRLIGKRKLLVLVENFDALLSSLGETGQREWRAFLQDSEAMIVVATAQRMTEGMTKVHKKKGGASKNKLADEEKAFFGFFTVETMSPFNVEEAARLLQKLARIKGDAELADFLLSRQGRARVRALHYLSGGNPRLYIVLSEFITKESFDELVRPFEEMVDERLTPYYQERLRWLSAQQRRLVEVLCQNQKPLTVAELAQKVFAAENTVSGQLKKLREMGYVEATKDKRESFYELKEPLMRLSMQVKDASDGEPLGLLVDFLKIWFEREELEQRLAAEGMGELGKAYLLSAVESLRLEGPILRHTLLRRGLDQVDPRNCSVEERERLIELADDTGAPYDLAAACFAAQAAGEDDVCIDFATRLFDSEKSNDRTKQIALHTLAATLSDREGDDILIAKCDLIIGLNEVSDGLLCHAHLIRGWINDAQGKSEGVIEDYTNAINLVDADPSDRSTALDRRAQFFQNSGRLDEAFGDWGNILALDSELPSDHRANAWIQQAYIHQVRGKLSDAITACSEVVKMENAPQGQIAEALNIRASAHRGQNENEDALKDYGEIVHLEGIPETVTAVALIGRAEIFSDREAWEAAKSDLERIFNFDADKVPLEIQIQARWKFWACTYNAGEKAVAKRLCRNILSEFRSVYGWVVDGILGDLYHDELDLKLLRTATSELVTMFADAGQTGALGEGLVTGLKLLQSEENLDAAKADRWAKAWESAAASEESMTVGIRLMNVGVNYLKTKERRELLRLPKEERGLVMKALGLDNEAA